MKSFTEQLRAFWKGLDRSRRIALVLALLGTFAALFLLQAWAFGTRYETIVSSRDPAEVRAVIEGLEEEKVPYRLSNDGLRVEVPTEMAGKARIRAAAAGVSTGLEGLDNLKLGISPRRELWSYQRALQGELVRTLNQLDEVEASRVHLVLPERSAFLGDESPGSAAITLRLAPGRSLSESQIRGIASLVAGAVEGLKPSQVVLVDEKGRLLSEATEPDPKEAQLTRLMELRHAYQESYKKTILEALVPVLGSEKHVRASVVVELDPTTTESTISSLDPNSQVVISEQTQDQQSSDQSSQGIPGTTSNLPEYTSAAGGRGASQQTSSKAISNYDYTRTQKHVVQNAGGVKRVSTAVVVDAARIEELAAKGLTAEEVRTRIGETVRAATAFDDTRGDTVTVSYLPFTETAEAATDLVEEGFDWMRYLPDRKSVV